MTSFMVPAVGGTAAVIAGVLVTGSGGGSGFSSDLAITVVTCIGNVLALLLAFAPLYSFVWPICNEQSVGDRTVYGHVLMLAGGAAWALYGIPTWPDTRISVGINGVTFLMQLFYVLVYIRYASGKARWIAVSLLLASLGVTGFLTWAVLVKVMARGEWDIRYVAGTASFISCLSYIAVWLDIAAVVNSEDLSNMDPLLEVVINTLNPAAWVYYAYVPSTMDNYIGVPNAIGILFLVAQLGVYFRHCRAVPEPEAEPEPEPEPAPQPEEDFGLVLMFTTPTQSPHADLPDVVDADLPEAIDADLPDAEIEVVVA